jgi:hypothetical protein
MAPNTGSAAGLDTQQVGKSLLMMHCTSPGQMQAQPQTFVLPKDFGVMAIHYHEKAPSAHWQSSPAALQQ